MKIFFRTLLVTFLGSMLLAFTLNAQAAVLSDLKYDSKTNLIQFTVTYTGGEQTHEFDLLWDSCQAELNDGGLKQVAARLVDSGFTDTGSDVITQSLQFPLQDKTCTPAELTIFSSKFHQSIQIK